MGSDSMGPLIAIVIEMTTFIGVQILFIYRFLLRDDGPLFSLPFEP